MLPRLLLATLAPVLAAMLAAPLSADEPSYPYPLPDWYRMRLKEARTTRISVDVKDAPVDDVLTGIAEKAGVAVSLEIHGKKMPDPMVLHLKDIPLGEALWLIGQFNGLSVVETPTGFVVTDDASKYAVPKHARVRADIRKRIQRLVEDREKAETDGGPGKDARVAIALSGEVDYAVEDTSLLGAIAALREKAGVNIVVDPKLLPMRDKRTLSVSKTPADKVLGTLLAGKAGYIITNGVVFVTTEANCRTFAAQQAAEARRQAAIRARLATPLKASPDGLSVGRLVALLKAELKGEVLACPDAWATAARLSDCKAGMTLGQVGARLARLGVRLEVEPERIWVVRLPKPEPKKQPEK